MPPRRRLIKRNDESDYFRLENQDGSLRGLLARGRRSYVIGQIPDHTLDTVVAFPHTPRSLFQPRADLATMMGRTAALTSPKLKEDGVLLYRETWLHTPITPTFIAKYKTLHVITIKDKPLPDQRLFILSRTGNAPDGAEAWPTAIDRSKGTSLVEIVGDLRHGKVLLDLYPGKTKIGIQAAEKASLSWMAIEPQVQQAQAIIDESWANAPTPDWYYIFRP